MFFKYLVETYLLASMLPMIAIGMDAMRPATFRLAIVTCVGCAYLLTALRPVDAKEPWDKVAADVTSRSAPQDIFVYWPPYAQWASDFYIPHPPEGREYLLDLELYKEIRPFRDIPFVDVSETKRLLASAAHAWIIVDRKATASQNAISKIETMLAQVPNRSIDQQSFPLGLMSFELISPDHDRQ